jgi:heterodisulfide reductase subunit A-like polyferredoxin
MNVVIVGGGISGVSAAKVLLKSGHKATILEQTDAPGGLMERIANCRVGFKTFFAEIQNAPGLEVITGSRIVDVDKLYEKSLVTLEDGRLIEADAVIIAAGLSPYEPKERTGRRILASLDYDRLIDQRNESLPEDLRRVAFILCVGSRCAEYPLCSTVCCSYTLREIKWTFQRGITPHITVFYNDLRFFGQEFYMEKLYREMGVSFIRANSRYLEEDADGVTMRYFNGGRLSEERFDYVVLAGGLRPNPTLADLSLLFGFSLDERGFVREAGSLRTDANGIYASGGSLEPMSIKDAILTGYGAATRCLKELDDRKHVPEITVYKERAPDLKIDRKATSYLFYLGTEDTLLKMFYEFFSEQFILKALELRKKGKDVLFVTRNLVVPSYSELLYEQARRAGVLFIHLEEDERIDLHKNEAVIAGPKGEAVFSAERVVTMEQYRDRMQQREFLMQYRSEPQLRWSPTKWDRQRYHAGFIRFPRADRWEEREVLGALGECLIEKDEERILPDVDEERCSGCGSCSDACPSDAIEMQAKEKQVSVFGPLGSTVAPVAAVKKELCTGCGLCASTCPSDVIGFKEASIPECDLV